MERLERALAVYLDWLGDAERPEAEVLLARNEDLREFLEAMLTDRVEVEQGVAEQGVVEARTIGDFRIEAEIGRGGMGVVYRARQLSLDRIVALKVLPAHVTLQPSAVARFRREASTAAKLEHPGIVKIHAVGSDGDVHFFAMELIHGGPLSRVDQSSGKPRSVRECVEIGASICDALAHAHEHGVVHRDVKPSNILIDEDGRPVLTDFGLARDLDAPGLTRTGAFAGTPYYVSPEQARGLGDIDARSDVFSLGATLYELLTGQRPFDGDSVPTVLAQITGAEPRDPLRLAPDLAPDLAAIVMAALEKDRARRYASATALGADLRAFLEYRPISVRRASVWMRMRRYIAREPLRATLAVVLALAVPTITGAIGYLVANRSAIDVGSREIERRTREERLARITIDYEAGDFRRALAVADEAVAAAPDDVEARALRAVALLALGRAAEALKEFDTGSEASRLPEADRAKVYILAAIGREAEAAELETRLGAPTSPEGLFLAGITAALRARNDRVDVARWSAVRDLFAHAMHVAPAPRLHYDLRWLDAILMTRDEAATANGVATLRQLWPDSPAALLYVAFASRFRDPKLAVECYRRVLASGYDHPRIHGTIAECLDRLGDKEGAARARADRVTSFRAREASGAMTFDDRVNIALALEEVGATEEAIAAARDATARAPKMPRAFVMLGWLLGKSGDQKGAVTAYERAVELAPDDSDALDRLGGARMSIGDAQGAAAAFRRETELAPKRAMAFHQLGNALFATKDFAGAVEANRSALALDPQRPEFHYNLGLAQWSAGQQAAAIASWERAVELRPDYERAKQALVEARK